MGLIIKNNTLIKNLSIGPAAGSGGGSSIPINTNGLFMFYDIGNTSSYPGSGTTMYNLVNADSRFEATMSNTPTYTSAGAASYISFSSSSEITVTPADLLDGVTNITTLSYWIKINNTPAGSRPTDVHYTYTELFRRYAGQWNQGHPVDIVYMNILNGGDFLLEKVGTNNSSRWQGLGVVNSYLNNWVNIGVTLGDNNGLRLYLNGVDQGIPSMYHYSVGSGRTLDTITQFKLFDASSGYGGQNIPFGNMAYYTRELTASEMLSNFDALKTRYGY